jgi:hypothetical protein
MHQFDSLFDYRQVQKLLADKNQNALQALISEFQATHNKA